jgi:hypothetical protein
VTRDFFFNQADNSPWMFADATIRQPTIDQYLRHDVSMRKKLASHDKSRYPDIAFSDEGVPNVGTRYRMHHIFPSPLFHHNVDWWRRLPRLGQIYTLGECLKDPTLLLICAIAIGNRALHFRLKVLLEHDLGFTFQDSGSEKSDKTAYSIATSIAGGDEVDEDEFLFLIAHLLVAHHWFYPYDAAALKAFNKLGAAADDVLQRHGWPVSGLKEYLQTKHELLELVDDLARDLLFLIYACSRWGAPESQKADSDSLFEKLKKKIPDVLAVMCGEVQYVTLSVGTLKFHSVPPNGQSYICVRTPTQLQGSGWNDPMLPLFSIGQVPETTEELSTANAYIQGLCPAKFERHDNRWNALRVTRVRGDRVVDKNKRMGKWFTGYARARCMLKIVNPPQAGAVRPLGAKAN